MAIELSPIMFRASEYTFFDYSPILHNITGINSNRLGFYSKYDDIYDYVIHCLGCVVVVVVWRRRPFSRTA